MGLTMTNTGLLSIFIPSSTLEDAPDLRAKTEKAFRVARSLAIFGVNHCVIYRDPFITKAQHRRSSSLIRLILEYLECPQYLRKLFYPRHSSLAFVGILPPLAIPHHFIKPPSKVGEIREAAVFLSQGKIWANVGAKKPIEVIDAPKLRLSERIKRMTISISSLDPLKCEILDKAVQARDQYWGYKVRVSDALLSHVLSDYNGIIVATSSHCSPLTPIDKAKIAKEKKLAIIFGSPTKGLQEILKAEQKRISNVAQLCFNATTRARTRTIRLEEAILLTLAKLAS